MAIFNSYVKLPEGNPQQKKTIITQQPQEIARSTRPSEIWDAANQEPKSTELFWKMLPSGKRLHNYWKITIL